VGVPRSALLLRSTGPERAACCLPGCAGLEQRLHGFKEIKDFVASLEKPRLVQACRSGTRGIMLCAFTPPCACCTHGICCT